MEDKKTPLYEMHLACGGRIVPFAGWLLPVQYATGILAEHKAVRTAAGMFDVSHMGEFTLKGATALADLNRLLTNDYTSMTDGKARYGIMCYESGGAVDDLLVYKKGEDDYLIVVNAANVDKDFAWMQQHVSAASQLVNISDQIAQIALQGPKAIDIISQLTATICEKNYTFIDNADIKGIKVLLSRTGYTGEDGFELYCRNEDAAALWQLLLDTGKPYGLIPCGLGARDTLRLESAMPLYGHELSAEINPMESGLDHFIKFTKDFIGKQALEKPQTRTRIGLQLTDRGIAREHCDVYLNGVKAGHVTSGTFAPTLQKAIAMALVDSHSYDAANVYEIDVRGKLLKAQVTPLPFYKRSK